MLYQEQTESPKNSRYIDFLDILLTARDENGQGLSRLDIRNEVDTFLFEGKLFKAFSHSVCLSYETV